MIPDLLTAIALCALALVLFALAYHHLAFRARIEQRVSECITPRTIKPFHRLPDLLPTQGADTINNVFHRKPLWDRWVA